MRLFSRTLSALLSISLCWSAAAQADNADESANAPQDSSVQEQTQALVDELKERLQEVDENGSDFDKLDKIGDLYLKLGDAKRAVLVFEKAIADHGGTEALFLKLSRVMAIAGGPEYALEVLNLGMESFPLSESLTLEMGKAYLSAEKSYAAVATFKKLVALDPEKEAYRYHLADAYRSQKKWDLASELIDPMVEAKTEQLEAYLMKGDLLLAQGQLRDGVRYFENLFKEHPDSSAVKQLLVHSYQLYAYTESKAGRLSRGVRSLRSALEVEPQNPETRVALASFLSELGEYEEAETTYEAVISDNPNYLETYALYGKMLESLDRPNEAVDAFRSGLAKAREVGADGAVNLYRGLLGIGK